MKTKSYDKQQPETIQVMFGSIADGYDRMNGILSFQLHRLWNRKLIHEILSQVKSEKDAHSHPSFISADLCCGTGAISLPWLASNEASQTTYLVDFCPEMLHCAKTKANALDLSRHQIHYIEADVQSSIFPESTLDFVTMAYGIRNVKSPGQCFKEVFAALKPGGVFGILELTEPRNRILGFAHRSYLKFALPLLGRLFSANASAYGYLSRSIRMFTKPEQLKKQLHVTGFSDVKIISLLGGISTLLIARKPSKAQFP